MRISDWSSDVCSSDLTDFEVGKLFSYNDYPERFPYDNQKSDRVTLIADYDIGDFTLTSQTAYVNWKSRRLHDLDFTAGTVMTFQATEPNELFSQELRLASQTEAPRSEERRVENKCVSP